MTARDSGFARTSREIKVGHSIWSGDASKERVMVWLESRMNRVQKVIPVKHRAPYSCVNVNAVEVETAAGERWADPRSIRAHPSALPEGEGEEAANPSVSAIALPMVAGESATAMPAARRAAIFVSAEPSPPLMIAPA